MAPFSRRSLLKGMLAGAGVAGASGLLPRLQRRASAQSTADAYPTIFILLRGGVDPAMHFDAKTNYVNRNVQEIDVRETAGGIRWYEPVLASMTNHIADCSVVRNITCSSSHINGWANAWYGSGGTDDAVVATPWASYLAHELLQRERVAAPNLVTYLVSDDQPRTDYITFNNSSPSPLAAAQRVLRLQDLADGLDVLQGLPDAAFQGRVFQTVSSLDAAHYSRTVQPRTTDAFTAANGLATELLTAPPPIVWPPDQNTMDLFNLDPNRIDQTINQGNQRMEYHLAMAYTMARLRLTHSVFVQSTDQGWDTHSSHDTRQRNASLSAFPKIERLFSALKATPSPIDGNLTMFDTTHVVITSELSRRNSVDTSENTDGLGTPHHSWTQAVLAGGRFKRDTVFGSVDANQLGVPADFTTGGAGGRNPAFADVQATILKANGVDPTPWNPDAEPIDFLIKPEGA